MGPERRHAIGHGVRVLSREGKWIGGLLAAASGHVLTAEQRAEHRIGYDDFWVELGLPSRQAVLDAGIHIGSPVVFLGTLRRVGELLVGPSIDDRIGLALIDALLRAVEDSELTADVWLAATVQEENGLHGSRALALAERFDAVVALEVGLVGDIPGVSEREFPTVLGGGPITVYRDSGIAYDRAFTNHLRQLASTGGISVQDGLFAGYRSDGLSFAEAGARVALLAVPTRYTHTPFETIHPDDLEATVELLRLLVTSSPPSMSGCRFARQPDT
jgi:endoglucanase